MKAALVAFVLFSTSLGMAAQDMGGANLLIPIAGRTAGAFGSQWRTDLVITNLEIDPVNVHISFYESATKSSFTSKVVPGNGTLVLEDVIRTTMATESGLGMLRVNAGTTGARVVARAYVHNRGTAAGEFGQGVPAVPVDALSQDHVLSGIVAGSGRRTNIGVANPWPTEVDVVLTLHDRNGEILAQDARTVAPLAIWQINDVFASLGVTPVAEASLRVNASAGVYPYASIVRNDSGDAVFVAGSGVRTAVPTPTPVCSEPAPLLHPYGGEAPAEQAVVVLRDGTPRDYVLKVLIPWHQFTVDQYFEDAGAFTATLTPQQIAALRCDGRVSAIRLDGAVPQK